MNPFTKNFLFITNMIPARSISVTAMPVMLSFRTGGTGQPHIDTPIDKYMSIRRNMIELISLFLRTGVSLSSS